MTQANLKNKTPKTISKSGSWFKSGKLTKTYSGITGFIKRRPFTVFFSAIILLFAVLLTGNLIAGSKAQPAKPAPVKTVTLFTSGSKPAVSYQAKIEKTGIVKIMALTPGIVKKVLVKEGNSVIAGQQLLTLSSNYQGGNAPAIQTQIAQAQYNNLTNTLSQQKDIIQKQRDMANKTDENAKDLRDISRQSLDETNALIASNESVLSTLKNQLNNPPPQSNNLISQILGLLNPSAAQQSTLQLQGQINQLQGGINQLQEAERQISYQSDTDRPPAQLADMQRDLALKQLDIQEKSLELNKEISGLQVSLAEVNEANMYPSTPIAGTVERVYVLEGQMVSPGTPLAVVTAPDHQIKAVLNVPENIAANMPKEQKANLYVGTQIYSVTPDFISTEATDGSLYTVVYPVSDSYSNSIADSEYIRIDIPVGKYASGSAVPLIPIDAVYQSQENSYVLVVNKNKAQTKTVSLGNVYGSFVEVTSGLGTNDKIILDRTVIAGDRIKY